MIRRAWPRLKNGVIERRRAEGKLGNLEALLAKSPIVGSTGIGHTRWATHGAPNETNAHPIATDKVAVVHNGIIENFAELRAELIAKGAVFTTDTDTEVGGPSADAPSPRRASRRKRRWQRPCRGSRARSRWPACSPAIPS